MRCLFLWNKRVDIGVFKRYLAYANVEEAENASALFISGTNNEFVVEPDIERLKQRLDSNLEQMTKSCTARGETAKIQKIAADLRSSIEIAKKMIADIETLQERDKLFDSYRKHRDSVLRPAVIAALNLPNFIDPFVPTKEIIFDMFPSRKSSKTSVSSELKSSGSVLDANARDLKALHKLEENFRAWAKQRGYKDFVPSYFAKSAVLEACNHEWRNVDRSLAIENVTGASKLHLVGNSLPSYLTFLTRKIIPGITVWPFRLYSLGASYDGRYFHSEDQLDRQQFSNFTQFVLYPPPSSSTSEQAMFEDISDDLYRFIKEKFSYADSRFELQYAQCSAADLVPCESNARKIQIYDPETHLTRSVARISAFGSYLSERLFNFTQSSTGKVYLYMLYVEVNLSRLSFALAD